MRAVEISHYGGPDVLRVVERARPEPQTDEVLVRVAAAGVSHADVMQRQGLYPPPAGASDIPGLECSGVREDTGEPVCALLTGGGYAEYVAVPVQQLLPLPRGWTAIEAACLPENIFTVYDNLVTRGRFAHGESLLVHGGTSGIGSTAIMLARALGASMILATAGSDEKCAACRDIGADAAFNYKTQDFVARVQEATNGRGVDAVVDIVGGEYIARDLECIAPDGRVLSIASAGGTKATIDLSRMMKQRASVIASSLRARTPAQKGAIRDALLRDVWPLLASKTAIRPLVDSTYAMEDAPRAHERMERSAHIGKIVLRVDEKLLP